MAKRDPTISFVVPVYNMGSYVANCLTSILNQQGNHDQEIIVIDDASTDASPDIIESFKDPRIRCFRHKENQGAARTITEGLVAARGTYIARIDPDDRYRPDFLDRTTEILNRYPDVGLVYGRVALMDARGQVNSGATYPDHAAGVNPNFFLDLLKRNDLPAPTVLGRREAWQLAVPIPAHMHFNDWYISLSIAERWSVYFIDEVLADYRVHANNMHHAMVRDGWAEPIIVEVLARFLETPWREKEKRKYRNEIYAAQYRELADQYFGCNRLADARRCYWQAVLRRPDQHVCFGVMRRLIGAYLGLRRYEEIKGLAKRIVRI